MKTNMHFRFAQFVLMVSTAFTGLIISFAYESNFTVPLALICFRIVDSARKLICIDRQFPFSSDRDVSGRTLVIGFVVCLVAFYAAMFYLVHWVSPGKHATHLIWTVLGCFWLIAIYPGYRWWKAQKRAVAIG